jgi:hypothetical protein
MNMTANDNIDTPERVALLQWTARMGAVTAEALARRQDTTQVAARARLGAAARDGLLDRRRLLAQQPALYVLSRAGMRRCGLRGLEPCRVSASNARHLTVCASVAAALERGYSRYRVMGERELRRDERELGKPIVSAPIGPGAGGERVLHRPDLVLWPLGSGGGSPVAVEVELTVKAPRRLDAICRAWARCRTVAGVLYIASPEVAQALARALVRVHAQDRIVVVGLDAICPDRSVSAPIDKC